ncbi:MFS transporter [Paenibacillus sp. P46E]|uniref:MFS transporter n=1 Tax=Paenibacillus sp. P46E TaxID=1349436 RepID=UPI00093B218F|nr:MFS transporter [Paenibacillus sp. P46E]OKP95451.1 MFS transporter [Paenibacillus sp. P46E]
MSNAWKVYLLAAVSFLLGTSEYIIAGILDTVARDVNVSVAAAGQLITVFSLAYAFGTPFLIAFTARMEQRKLLVYSLGVFVIGNIIAVVLPGFEFLIVSRVILALSMGVFVVTSFTVATKMTPPDKQGSAIATILMGFSTSLIIGVPLGRVIASAYDWRLIFGGIGALSILAMIVILLVIPRSNGDESVPLRKQLALIKQPKIIAALMITFLWISGYSTVYTYISPFLLSVTGMNSKTVIIALFAFGIASLFGSKLGGYSTDKWGFPRTLFVSMVLHVVALVLLSLSAHSPAIVFLVLIFWALSAWSTSPTQQYHLMTLAPAASGIMVSMNSSVLQLAMGAGAGIGGVVVEQASLASISWIGAAVVAIAATTVMVYLRVTGSKAQLELSKAIGRN